MTFLGTVANGNDTFQQEPTEVIELLTVIVLAPAYAGLMIYMIHPDTVGEDGLILQIVTCIIILFSSYSLISMPIPESTPYLTNDSFSLFSHHY